MSGWSTFRITIFAARRVLPPDFTTPANASKPRMNETGPDAVPPPASRSRDERILERFEPVPEPPLNSIASVLARSMIDSMVSSTELMKQALACCGVSFDAEVEPDRAVEGHALGHEHVRELVARTSRESAGVAK